jgi:hypothetical protein
MQIWAVTAGEYEEWRVLALFVEKTDAEQWSRKWDLSEQARTLGPSEVESTNLFEKGSTGPDPDEYIYAGI